MRTAIALGVALLVALVGGWPAAVAAPAQATPHCVPAPPRTDPSLPWPQRQLHPERVWSLTRGSGVTVGVVDTGVDAMTPQLAGGRVLPGVDVSVPGGRGDSDCQGHGTFVAGIVAAGPSAGAGFVGVAPDALVLPIRVTSLLPSDGSLTTASLARGIRAAVDGGARVINVSASAEAVDPELTGAVAYAAARDVVLVASAANGARRGDPVTYPASYPTVLAVGAVDAGGQHADFSQTGPYLGVVAPGVNVVSIGPGGPGQWQGNGTSYAAPFVAGTAALVRGYHPDLDAAQVVHRIETTADHPPGPLPDAALGWGMVDPVAAVTAVLPDEHGAASAVTIGPAPARAGPPPPGPGAGPAVAGVATVVAAVLVGAAALAARLGRAGHRRRWRPARVVELAPSRPGSSES